MAPQSETVEAKLEEPMEPVSSSEMAGIEKLIAAEEADPEDALLAEAERLERAELGIVDEEEPSDSAESEETESPSSEELTTREQTVLQMATQSAELAQLKRENEQLRALQQQPKQEEEAKFNFAETFGEIDESMEVARPVLERMGAAQVQHQRQLEKQLRERDASETEWKNQMESFLVKTALKVTDEEEVGFLKWGQAANRSFKNIGELVTMIHDYRDHVELQELRAEKQTEKRRKETGAHVNTRTKRTSTSSTGGTAAAEEDSFNQKFARNYQRTFGALKAGRLPK